MANNTDCNLDNLFKYELSTYPPALFNKNGMFLTPNKPQLSEAFARIIAAGQLLEPPDKAEFCILDGGSLLHRISWEKGVTFDKIAEK